MKQIDERIQETEDDMQELSLDGLKITKITPEIKARLGMTLAGLPILLTVFRKNQRTHCFELKWLRTRIFG